MNLSDVLDPASTAIVVVDMQNDYCAPGGSVAQRGHDISMIANMIPRLQQLGAPPPVAIRLSRASTARTFTAPM